MQPKNAAVQSRIAQKKYEVAINKTIMIQKH
jgi:hypothetical protein